MRKKHVFIIVLMLGISLVFSAPVLAKTKVAFALLWTIDDMGWTTAHYRGIEYLQKQLGDQEVGHFVVDGRAEKNDSVLEKPRIDIVGTLASAALLYYHGY